MKKTSSNWRRADAMSEEDIHAAALADPDAQPLTEERLAHMKRTPQVKVIRRALGLSQEEFAARFQIPLGTLRDWEQGRKDPDAAARAYLVVIGRNPSAVSEALAGRHEAVPAEQRDFRRANGGGALEGVRIVAGAPQAFALNHSIASSRRSSPQNTSPFTTKVGEPKTPSALASSVLRR